MGQGKTKEKLHGKTNNVEWIFDTGATHHVTGTLAAMTNVKTIKMCPVGLPDCEVNEATCEGSVVLDGGLRLDHVLYVPQLNCNLISVLKLIDDSDCIVQCPKTLTDEDADWSG